MSENSRTAPASGLAITGLVLGIFTLLMFWVPVFHLLPGLLAVCFGVIGLAGVRRGTASGGGMALAGVLCAILGMVPTALIAVTAIAFYADPPEIEFVQIDPMNEDPYFEDFHENFAREQWNKRRELAPAFVTAVLESPSNHGGFFTFDFTPDGKLVAGGTGTIESSSDDEEFIAAGEVILWDAGTGEIAKTLGNHQGSTVGLVKFGDGGRVLTSVSTDNHLVRVWDVRGEKHISQFKLKGDFSLNNLPIASPDGRWLANVPAIEIPPEGQESSQERELTVWDTKMGSPIWSVPAFSVGWQMCFAPDSATLVSHAGLTLTAWDVETGDKRWEVEDRGKVKAFLATPDGTAVWGIGREYPAGGQLRGKLKCWNLASGEVITETNVEVRGGLNPRRAAFYPDGKSMAIIGFMQRKLGVYDTASGEETTSIELKPPHNFRDAAFTADLKRMVCDYGFQVGPSVIDVDKLLVNAK